MEHQKTFLEAVSFAAQKHQGQLRKDGLTPYVAHPFRVATHLALEFGVTDGELLAAAVLHDTIEDTLVDYDDLVERFGDRVADVVSLLSQDNRLPEERREEEYFGRLQEAPVEVKLCKLADVLDNLIDSEALSTAGRKRAARRAQRLVDLFASDLGESHGNALEAVARQLAELES